MSTLELPAGLSEYRQRDLPNGGLVEFEYARVGMPKKDGEPRKTEWRAYFYTPPEGARKRMLSVTTLLDAILPKGGLPSWAEARGIEGACEALAKNLVGRANTPLEWVQLVRTHKLGADRARDTAAARGINVHALLQVYMETGEVPLLKDHPVEHHGYLRALCSWLLERDPEPESVEELVCDPDAGFAGRRDLVARVGGVRRGYDAKTQERCGIYSSAHLQVKMYERAAVACGEKPCDDLYVVVFAADGEWREMPCEASDLAVERALAFADAVRPIDSTCESWNRKERKARA